MILYYWLNEFTNTLDLIQYVQDPRCKHEYHQSGQILIMITGGNDESEKNL